MVSVFGSCTSTKSIREEIKMDSAQAYFQKWVAGIEGGGSGIHFYLEFKSALPSDINLEKIIFRGYEVPFEKQDDLHFIAKIKTENNQQKSDSDTSKTISSSKNNTVLEANEAVLIFSKNGKTFQQVIRDVKEKPMLYYPSAKPKI